MKIINYYLLGIIISLSICFTPHVVATDFGGEAIRSKFDKADVVVVQFNDIRASVFTFYDDNTAFPASMAVLSDPNDRYYAGNVISAFGTNFGGAISADGKFFEISVDLVSPEIATYVATRVNTQAVGTVVTLAVGSPASSSIVTGFISRHLDPARPFLNEMETHLSLGGNDINNINIANATKINIAELTTTDTLNVLTATTTLDFTSTGTSSLNDLNVAGTTTVSNLTSTGFIKINGTAEFDSTMSVLGATNLNSTLDVVDLITASNGVTVTGGVTTDTLDATTITSTTLTTMDVESTGTATLNSVKANNIETTDLSVLKEFTVGGDITANADLQVLGTTNLNGLINNGDTYLNGNLDVLGLTTMQGAVFNGNVVVNSDLTAAFGLYLGNSDTRLSQSSDQNKLRVENTVGWYDMGAGASGLVEFSTDQDGYTFDKKLAATDILSVDGVNGLVQLVANNGGPGLTMSNGARNAKVGIESTKGYGYLNGTALTATMDGGNTDGFLWRNSTNSNADGAMSLTNDGKLMVKSQLAFRNNKNTYVSSNGNYIRLQSQYGYADMGAGNSAWFHFNTDRTNFYMGKGLHVNGQIRVYGSNTYLTNNHIYENGSALVNKYLGKNARAADSAKLAGVAASKFARRDQANTFTQNQLISKKNSWLTLDSPGTGGSGTDQGAGISIGESGYKGSAALHLTYNGNGTSYIGMGAVNSSTNIPQYAAQRFGYTSNDTNFLGRIISKSSNYGYDSNSSKYGINLGNSDLVGLNGMYFADTANSQTEGLMFKRNSGSGSSSWSNMRIYGDALYIAPNAASTSYKVWAGDTLYAKDVKLRSSIGGRNSLQQALAWIDKCKTGVSAGCIDSTSNSGAAETHTLLFGRSNGMGTGDINLSQDYDKFKWLLFIGSSDNSVQFISVRQNVTDLKLAQTIARSKRQGVNIFGLGYKYSFYWNGYFSTKRKFKLINENSKVWKVYGINPA